MFRHSSEVMVPYRTGSLCKTAYISVNKSAYLQALFFSFLGKKKKWEWGWHHRRGVSPSDINGVGCRLVLQCKCKQAIYASCHERWQTQRMYAQSVLSK